MNRRDLTGPPQSQHPYASPPGVDVHLVGASAKFKLQMHISRMGYTPPIIATPEELLEELS